jgi:hypothetical protein
LRLRQKGTANTNKNSKPTKPQGGCNGVFFQTVKELIFNRANPNVCINCWKRISKDQKFIFAIGNDGGKFLFCCRECMEEKEDEIDRVEFKKPMSL